MAKSLWPCEDTSSSLSSSVSFRAAGPSQDHFLQHDSSPSALFVCHGAELGGIFGWIVQHICYKEHIQRGVSMLVLSAFSWAACPGMWEGKVGSALAHVCSATEWLLRCPLQPPAPAFAFFPDLAPRNCRIIISTPASWPLRRFSQAAVTWAMFPFKGFGPKRKALVFLSVQGMQLHDSERFSDFPWWDHEGIEQKTVGEDT